MLSRINFGQSFGLSFAFPLIVALAFAASLAFLVLTSQPKSGQVAVVYSPLIKTDRALEIAAASGALILRAGGWRNFVIIAEPDSDTRQRLYDAGAWLVIDTGSALGCVVGANPSKQYPTSDRS